ncbi:MAG: hypothetical protein A2007_04090 [Verrucomicrobia bacterium GWC2_42_7]|nr:MAG: hypothetical protein A2007_04090 [Verrucomicrobia bacterium GWC2_42_7]
MSCEEIRKNIQKYVDKWRNVEGSLIMVLHDIQEDIGYVPREWAMEIGKALDIKLARIYEVLTFYHYFKLKPQGKHSIHVCTGTACHIKGAPAILEILKTQLGFNVGETTADRLFNLDVVRCVGACGLAPAVVIDGEVNGKSTPEKIIEKVKSLQS